MSSKYLNKYRIETTRATWWDYAGNGMYFITINTKNRNHYFGEIHNGEMNLSEIGKLADQYWLEIPNHFPGVTLDAFVIMPDHMHGILIVENRDQEANNHKKDNNNGENGIGNTPKLGVSTGTDTSTGANHNTNTANHQTEMASQKWIPQSLGVIINQYKRKCTIDARKINSGFAWQSLYHDHIIRNEQEFLRIRQYIINNPAKWGHDS